MKTFRISHNVTKIALLKVYNAPEIVWNGMFTAPETVIKALQKELSQVIDGVWMDKMPTTPDSFCIGAKELVVERTEDGYVFYKVGLECGLSEICGTGLELKP